MVLSLFLLFSPLFPLSLSLLSHIARSEAEADMFLAVRGEVHAVLN